MVINIGAVHSPFRHACRLIAVLAMAVGMSGWAQVQVLDEPVKGFQVTDHDKVTGRRKWLLTGDTAQNASPDDVLLTGARMTFFDDSGGTNLVVVTPKSVYRTKAKEVVSPEAIEVRTGNGGMSIAGVGFHFRQSDTSLIISNEVHATIRKDVAGSRSFLPGSTNAAAVAPPGGAHPASSNQVVNIFSDQFLFQTNRGVFLHQVRVHDSQGTLVCEVLTIELAQAGRQIERIIAEQQVVAESGDTRASGDLGVYVLARDEVTITGNPSWRQGPREGRAEELIFERRTRHFQALRNVRMRFPPGSFRETGSLLPGSSAPSSTAPATAGRFATVNCDEFEFVSGLPGANPSVTTCRGNVLVEDDRGKLRCVVLTIESARESRKTERVVADREVVVEQEDNRVACERAEYLAPVEQIELTGRPKWRVGLREGSSDRIKFDLRNQTYRASGRVEMSLPPGAAGSSAWLLPVDAAPTGNVATIPGPTPAADTRPVSINSDDFEFRSASGVVGMDEGVYRGHVRVRDPRGMTLECGSLTGTMFPGSSQMQTAVARDNVVIQANSPTAERVGRGDVAVYSAEREEVELTGETGVEILMREPSGVTRAHGRKIVYARNTDIAVLSGDPRITSPSGVVTGETLVLDRSASKLKATGYWKITLKRETLKGAMPPSRPKVSTAPAKPPDAT